MATSLPEDVVQPLFDASNSSSSLEECLQFLLEVSRTDSGRSYLASRAILPSVLRLLELLPYPSSRRSLILSLKLLRNLCAGEISNQKAFVYQNGAVLVSDVLISATGESNPDFETIRFGLQVLANVVLAGEEHQRDVWKRFFRERFFGVAKVRRKETCDPLCKVVYICCDGSAEIAAQLCSDEGLRFMAEIIRTASSDGFGEDWLKLLLSRICVEDNCFPQLFSKLHRIGTSEDCNDATDDAFSSEQAFLLRVVSDIVNERIQEVSIPKDTAVFLLEIFKRSIEVFDFALGQRSELPTESTVVDVMGYSLTIMRDTCAGGSLEELKKDNSTGDIVETLLSLGLIELLLGLLRDLEPPAVIKKALRQTGDQEGTSSLSSNPCPYRGFRRDIVAVIGNCAYRRKRVQEEIRQKDGLPLMLQQCVTDEENPFLREWGIWCMRNLLEGNEENQRAVSGLEIQGSVEQPELAELGLRVEVDPKTRRPKLVNVP